MEQKRQALKHGYPESSMVFFLLVYVPPPETMNRQMAYKMRAPSHFMVAHRECRRDMRW